MWCWSANSPLPLQIVSPGQCRFDDLYHISVYVDLYHIAVVTNYPTLFAFISEEPTEVMNPGGDGSMSGLDTKRKSLLEVPLRWTEFMWSLEKLRHRPYSKKARER